MFLLCFAAAVLFKHVDTLGAYSIPSETGLLISSLNDT